MFNILDLILKEFEKNNIKVDGIAHNPFRIDFAKNVEITEEKMQLAEDIAYEFLDNEEYHRLQWEDSQKRIITSEKAALLVQLLIQKGLMTEEEVNSIF